ncbi:hypothetical protein [Halalkalicoccus subterraneus]|uniref:hypothetical protein n=1 Tax=Halalkalicoccus subterraneus TaxID=2675002 RepID=UPI000EFBCEBE|nr:hypothetical protein [Halalkalicoccus subterraneus]
MVTLATFRRPEYIGTNRCWPCTAANGVILLVCCLALAPFSPLLALAGLVAGTGAIWLRGYLVPYTPQLTGRVHRALADEPDHAATGSLAPDGHDDDLGERTLAALIEMRVIRPENERLQLAAAFVDDWRAEMRRLRALSDTELIDAIEAVVEGTTAEVLDGEHPLVVLTGPAGGEAWVTRPAVIAELAAVAALDGRIPGQSSAERLAAARALRAFLERCPVCESLLEERDPRRCCGNPRNVEPGAVLACPECNQTLHRFTP